MILSNALGNAHQCSAMLSNAFPSNAQQCSAMLSNAQQCSAILKNAQILRRLDFWGKPRRQWWQCDKKIGSDSLLELPLATAAAKNHFLFQIQHFSCMKMMKNGAPNLISGYTIISIFGEFFPLRILTFQKFSPPYGNFRPYAYYIFGKFSLLR